MKARNTILIPLAVAAAFVAGLFIGMGRERTAPAANTETRETTVDTVPFRALSPKEELALGTRRYTVPAYRFTCTLPRRAVTNPRAAVPVENDSSISETVGMDNDALSCDSVDVELPVVQRHYADSAYEAWVSGPLDPRLDSLRVYARTTVVTRREWKPPRRWHVGVTAGYGYGPRGFQPYIGVGLTYSLVSF